MTDRQMSTQCVQQLAALDAAFFQENAEAVRDAAEFPHAVMMLFAGYLARRFADAEHRDQLIVEQKNLVAAVLAALEHCLLEGDADVRTVILDSFVEQIYDENLWLFDYLLNKAGPLLHREMQSHMIWRKA